MIPPRICTYTLAPCPLSCGAAINTTLPRPLEVLEDKKHPLRKGLAEDSRRVLAYVVAHPNSDMKNIRLDTGVERHRCGSIINHLCVRGYLEHWGTPGEFRYRATAKGRKEK